MIPRPSNKEVRKLLRQAERAGCRVEGGGGAHYRVIAPTGVRVALPSTTRLGPHTIKQVRGALRREGVQC